MILTLDSFTPAYLTELEDAARSELAGRSLHYFTQQMWPSIEPREYKDNWHIRVICEHLQAVTQGEIKRLIINIPPRCMKSTLVSCTWPAWTWAQEGDAPLEGPGARFLYASYSHALSVRDSVKTRRIIESPLYQQWYGDGFELHEDQNTKIRFSNNENGYRLATSVGGSLTGDGGDILVVDDPINAQDADSEVVRYACNDWWDTAMSTRLNDEQTGAVVVIMQRLHQNDFTGYLLDKMDEDGESDWEHLCLPMRYEVDHPNVSIHDIRIDDGALLWPEHRPENTVVRQERDLGSYNAAGQLQQRPSPRSGGLFEEHWWQYVEEVPAAGMRVRGWDFAATVGGGDWTVGLLMSFHDGIFYIEDIQRKQLSSHGVRKLIEAMAELDGRRVSISIPNDPGQAGNDQVDSFIKMLVGYDVRSSPETGDKELRATAHGQAAQCEAGNIKLKRGAWNKPFVQEMALFPRGTYDDQADAFSRAFGWLVDNRSRRLDQATAAPTFIEDGSDW